MVRLKRLTIHSSRWLDKTPTSRVIARCTQDIRAGMTMPFQAHFNIDRLCSRWTCEPKLWKSYRDDIIHANQTRSSNNSYTVRTQTLDDCLDTNTTVQYLHHSWYNRGNLRRLVRSDLYQSSAVRETRNEQRTIPCLRALRSCNFGVG